MNGLLAASYLLIRRGEAARGAQLMSAAHELGAQVGYQLAPSLRPDFERYRQSARTALGEPAFASEWQTGRSFSFGTALDFALQPANNEALAMRSRALSGAGRLAWHDSDIKASRDLVLEGLDAARKAGDTESFVYAVAAFVRFAMSTGDDEGFIPQSRKLSEEAVVRSRRAGDQSLLLESLTSLAYAQAIAGHLEEAHATTEEAIALGRELRDEVRLVRVLNNRASMDFFQGRFTAARAVSEESLSICRRLGRRGILSLRYGRCPMWRASKTNSGLRAKPLPKCWKRVALHPLFTGG